MPIYCTPAEIAFWKSHGIDTSEIVEIRTMPMPGKSLNIPTFMGEPVLFNSPSSPCKAVWTGDGFVLVRDK